MKRISRPLSLPIIKSLSGLWLGSQKIHKRPYFHDVEGDHVKLAFSSLDPPLSSEQEFELCTLYRVETEHIDGEPGERLPRWIYRIYEHIDTNEK